MIRAHEHFGMDLAPGLAMKLDATYLPDAVALAGIEGGRLTAVREVYSGMVRSHVRVEMADGLVMTVWPRTFPVQLAVAAGQLLDKSAEAAAGPPLGAGSSPLLPSRWTSPRLRCWSRWVEISRIRTTWRCLRSGQGTGR
jgi:electron transfer flavoprotein alpha subunit